MSYTRILFDMLLEVSEYICCHIMWVSYIKISSSICFLMFAPVKCTQYDAARLTQTDANPRNAIHAIWLPATQCTSIHFDNANPRKSTQCDRLSITHNDAWRASHIHTNSRTESTLTHSYWPQGVHPSYSAGKLIPRIAWRCHPNWRNFTLITWVPVEWNMCCCRLPLNQEQMYKMGLRVTGRTGEAKLKVS